MKGIQTVSVMAGSYRNLGMAGSYRNLGMAGSYSSLGNDQKLQNSWK